MSRAAVVNKKPCNECMYIDAYKVPFDERDPRSQDMYNFTLDEMLDYECGGCHMSNGTRICYGIAKDIGARTK